MTTPPPVASPETTEALRMLGVFASVGAYAFDITHTNLDEEKRGFRPAQTLAQTRVSLPYLLPSSARRHNNVIVRPRTKTTALIQLDDLTPENLSRIAPVAFLTLQTSPRGTQGLGRRQRRTCGLLGAPEGGFKRRSLGLRRDPAGRNP